MVVGAGIIGLMCARELARRGLAVTVVDGGEPGASDGNTGLVTPSFSGPLPAPGAIRQAIRRNSPLAIPPSSLPGLAAWLLRFASHCNPRAYMAGLEAVAALARPTMALYDELGGLAFQMHRQGLLFAFRTRGTASYALADLEMLHGLGYARPRPVGRDELRALEPAVSADRGIFVEGERHVRAEQLAAALAKQLPIVRGTVTGFVRRGRTVCAALADDGRPIEADCFVLAAGVRSGALTRALGWRLPLAAGRGYSLTVAQPSLRLRQPLYLDEAKVACSPFADALRLAGTLELTCPGRPPDPRRLALLRRSADAWLPGWDAGAGVASWSGMRPLTPDGLPVIGAVPGSDNAFIATGHAMLGMTLAPVTARGIADLVCTGDSDLPLGPFRPARAY